VHKVYHIYATNSVDNVTTYRRRVVSLSSRERWLSPCLRLDA